MVVTLHQSNNKYPSGSQEFLIKKWLLYHNETLLTTGGNQAHWISHQLLIPNTYPIFKFRTRRGNFVTSFQEYYLDAAKALLSLVPKESCVAFILIKVKPTALNNL